MKKYIFIICLGLLILSVVILFKSFYNINDNVESVLSTKDFSRFKNFIKVETNEGNIDGHWEYFRDITYDFKEGVFLFNKYIKDEKDRKTSSYEIFEVKLVVSHDEIVYYEINIQKNKKVKFAWSDNYSWEPYYKTIQKFRNEKEFNELKKSFRKIYHSELNEKELFITDLVYGENCGIAGMNSVERDKLNSFVIHKDKSSILKWLKSANTEKQIYAVEGMLSLKKTGITINETELKIIRYIMNKKGNIKVCHTCVYSNSEISKIINYNMLK